MDGNAVDDPFSLYGKDKMDEFCRRIITKKGGATPPSMISVDSKILDFLKMLYFGVTDNPFEAASRSAYTDMCRTIRFNGKNGDVLRKAVDALLEERTPELVAVNDAEDFTKWHHSICEEIVAMYEAEGIEFYIGQAQKWVNMTLKYLYVLVPDVVEPFYCFLHIPLDNYIIDIAKKQYPEPRSTFLVYGGKKLPAKHIRGMAYQEHYGVQISKNDFGGGMETVRFFERLGFEMDYHGISKDTTLTKSKKRVFCIKR